MAEIVTTITIKEDIGGTFPRYRAAVLILWDDQSVTWEYAE